MKLLQQFLRNIIKYLIFCQIPYGGRFYSHCSTFPAFLSVPHVTNTCIYFCWLGCSDVEQDFELCSIDRLSTELNCSN